jgi:hypothetical protein
MSKSGTKNVVAIKESIKNIETLTARFKRKRLTQDQYILLVNQNLANMTNERDYIEYLINIGQY